MNLRGGGGGIQLSDSKFEFTRGLAYWYKLGHKLCCKLNHTLLFEFLVID